LAAVIRQLYRAINHTWKGDARLAFIRQSRRYAQQDGFDGAAAFRSLVVYILVVSKYSVLKSVLNTNSLHKKSIKKSITKIARLFSQNADREKLDSAGASIWHPSPSRTSRSRTSFDAEWYSDKAVDSARQAATEFVRAPYDWGLRSESAIEWAVKAAVASAQYGAESVYPHGPLALSDDLVYTDYAKALLKIMKKEAERAKRKSNPKKSGGFTAAQNKKLRLGWAKAQPGFMISETVLSKPVRALAVYRKGSKWGSGVIDSSGQLIRMVEVFKHSSAFAAAKSAENIVLEKPKKKVAKKKVAKKKVAKKKVARKKTPEWQLLINRCRKLWDHYCERPSKKRLKPVLEHLEKMKASTSKKVADERKSCLRIANKEARSLKMK